MKGKKMYKSKTTALVLCLLLGCFGMHRFYVGKVESGLAMLITCGGCGIWCFVDLFMIIFDKFRDVNDQSLI